MWRSAAGRRLSAQLLLPRVSNHSFINSSTSHPLPCFPPSYVDASVGRSYIGDLFSLRLLSSLDSSNPSSDQKLLGFVEAGPCAASPVEVSAAIGSLESISRRYRDVSEALRHYGRCYWELSKARLRSSLVDFSSFCFFFPEKNFIFSVIHFISHLVLCSVVQILIWIYLYPISKDSMDRWRIFKHYILANLCIHLRISNYAFKGLFEMKCFFFLQRCQLSTLMIFSPQHACSCNFWIRLCSWEWQCYRFCWTLLYVCWHNDGCSICKLFKSGAQLELHFNLATLLVCQSI